MIIDPLVKPANVKDHSDLHLSECTDHGDRFLIISPLVSESFRLWSQRVFDSNLRESLTGNEILDL